MTTIMPKDDDNNPIPALRLKDGGSHKMLASDTSSINTTPFSTETKVVSLYTTEDIFIEFGNSNAEATISSHFFPAGVYYDFAINNAKQLKDAHISVIKATANNASVYISEKE